MRYEVKLQETITRCSYTVIHNKEKQIQFLICKIILRFCALVKNYNLRYEVKLQRNKLKIASCTMIYRCNYLKN